MGKCQSHAASGKKECDDHPAELRLKSTMDLSDDDDSIKKSSRTPSALSIFNEDILLSILSYVADVPFEMTDSVYGIESQRRRAPTDSYSTLTHTLPLVSKQFYNLTSTHDLYWKAALLRLVKKEPNTWGEGLKRIIFDAKCDEIRDEIMERNRNRAAVRGRRDKRTKNGQLNDEPIPQSVLGAEDLDTMPTLVDVLEATATDPGIAGGLPDIRSPVGMRPEEEKKYMDAVYRNVEAELNRKIADLSQQITERKGLDNEALSVELTRLQTLKSEADDNPYNVLTEFPDLTQSILRSIQANDPYIENSHLFKSFMKPIGNM